MSSFKYNNVVQEYIEIISREGRTDELIKACDYYHHEFPDKFYAYEWGFNFGVYLGQFHFGSDVFRFETKNGTTLYFIGSEEIVKEKLYKLL